MIVETKAVLNLAPAHEAQLVNYLTATRLDVGLLLNFGASRLEFKRRQRTFRPKGQSQEEDRRLRQDCRMDRMRSRKNGFDGVIHGTRDTLALERPTRRRAV